MKLTKAQKDALEALAPMDRIAIGVSVYDWGEHFSMRQVHWIHPATLAKLERERLIESAKDNWMKRRITDIGRKALEEGDA